MTFKGPFQHKQFYDIKYSLNRFGISCTALIMLDYTTRQGRVAKENTAVRGLLGDYAKPLLVQLEEKLQPSIANM